MRDNQELLKEALLQAAKEALKSSEFPEYKHFERDYHESFGELPFTNERSLDNYIAAQDGDFRPIFSEMGCLDGPVPIMDRLTYRLVMDGKIGNRRGPKQDTRKMMTAHALVTWLKHAHGYPKDAAVERVGELMNANAKTIRTWIKKAPTSQLAESLSSIEYTDEIKQEMQILLFPDYDLSKVGSGE